MSWFKYLKSSEIISQSSINTNYSYPYCKRYISKFIPRDTIPKNFWLFINIKNININKYQTSDINIESDDNSYLVIYEKDNNFYPVKTIIYNDVLYFQSYEEHLEKQLISGNYSIYYNTPNLKKVQLITNGSINDYKINVSTNPFQASYNDVVNEIYSVNLQSESSYNFSFINSNESWKKGVTTIPGSKAYISFTGPSIKIYGSTGPSNGKFRLRVVSLPDLINQAPAAVAVDWKVIDTYSSSEKDNVIFYQKTDLQDKEYVIEIENLYDKNILSSGTKLQLTSYSFSYNLFLSIEKELLNQVDNSFTLIAGVR